MNNSKHKLSKTLILVLLGAFLVGDLSYSFFQHMNQSLDGDMAWNIVPDDEILPIFENPLGFKTLQDDLSYPNPNRFFAHWIYKEGTLKGTRFLGRLTHPVNAIYLYNAITKTILQFLLIFLVVGVVCGHNRIFTLEFLLSAAIVSSLFQTNGFQPFMGIVDKSITYSFFYALPLGLVILFFRTFFMKWIWNRIINPRSTELVLLVILAVTGSLSGPLNPGIILVISLLFFASKAIRGQKLKIGNPELLMIVISFLSLYSLYLGRHNEFSQDNSIPMLTAYLKLPYGLFYLCTEKLGVPVLLIGIVINSFLIYKDKGLKLRPKYKTVIVYTLAFCLLYLLLLPLGGYRDYRPLIIRYDTFLPVTLCLIFLFAFSSRILFQSLSNTKLIFFSVFIALFILFFTISDKAEFDTENCERDTLYEIQNSDLKEITISQDCPVLAWDTRGGEYELNQNAKLLQLLGVTEELKVLRIE